MGNYEPGIYYCDEHEYIITADCGSGVNYTVFKDGVEIRGVTAIVRTFL